MLLRPAPASALRGRCPESCTKRMTFGVAELMTNARYQALAELRELSTAAPG